MKKKIFMIVTCMAMMFALASCGSNLSYEGLDLEEYIEVGKYKGLKTSDYTVEVTEDEVTARIDSELEASASNQKISSSDTIKDGDTVNIDYVGKKDGKKFDGGSAEGYDLLIGSDSFIEGFEDGLIGKSVGEKVDLQLVFPEDYSEQSLAGEAVVFSVTINSATRLTSPEYNLDFVKNTTEYDSLDAYEKAVEKQIYEEKEAEEISNQQNELWSQALENTKVIKYPKKIVDYFIDFNSNQIDEMAKAYGMTRAEMLTSYEFGDEEEFAVVNEDSSKLQVKQEMLIEYIADKEKLTYSEDEASEVRAYYESMGYDDKTIESQTGRNMDDYVRIVLLQQKVLDFLLENADIS